MMTDLTTVRPPLGLQTTSDDMSPEQRWLIGIRNIELLCDLDWRGRLPESLAQGLAQNKV